MVVADGVNWGDKSMLAARCAVFGSVRFLEQMLYNSHGSESEFVPVKTTRRIAEILREAVTEAHNTILEHGGGLTSKFDF